MSLRKLLVVALGRLSEFISGDTLDLDGHLTIRGTGRHVQADFSNALTSLRASFQTSEVNGNSLVNVSPNGTSVTAAFHAYNSSAQDNCGLALFRINGTEVALNASIVGTGTYVPFGFYTGGSLRVTIDTAGDVLFSGTGRRIRADFGNATVASRASFQASGVNDPTVLGAIPNGTNVTASYQCFNSSAQGNCAIGIFRINGTEVAFLASAIGTGTFLPLNFYTNGVLRLGFDVAGNGTFAGPGFYATVGGSAFTIDSGATAIAATLRIANTSANGAGILLAGNGATTPFKWVRCADGAFQVLNSAYTVAILQSDDAGNVRAAATLTAPTLVANASTIGLRLKDSNVATGAACLFYSDVGNFYFLLTASGDADGSFNTLRPLQIDKGSGLVTMGNGLAVSAGGLTVGGVAITEYVRAAAATTATLAHRHQTVPITANFTVPASTFAAGDVVHVYNDSAGALSLLQGSGLTLRNSNGGASGNVALAARGFVNVWFNSATEAVVSGNGI